MKIIGLTGSIGAGKSTVARMLEKLGAAVIDADAAARAAVRPGTPGYQAVVARFGSSILNSDGTIDRKALGRRVFADARSRRTLEAIIHPTVRREMARRVEELRSKKPAPPAAVLDVPLLIETGMHLEVDSVWVVVADEEEAVRRVMERDGVQREDVLARLSHQMPQEEKASLAHVIIDNSGTRQQTEARVARAWTELF